MYAEPGDPGGGGGAGGLGMADDLGWVPVSGLRPKGERDRE